MISKKDLKRIFTLMFPLEFTPPFTIEMKEVGIWFDIERNIATLGEALRIASAYAEKFGNDEKVRILDFEGKII